MTRETRSGTAGNKTSRPQASDVTGGVGCMASSIAAHHSQHSFCATRTTFCIMSSDAENHEEQSAERPFLGYKLQDQRGTLKQLAFSKHV